MARPYRKKDALVAVREADGFLRVRVKHTDGTQKLVENLFTQGGKSLQDIEIELGLTPEEAESRFDQVFHKYMQMSKMVNRSWARVQGLCVLRQSYTVCESIRLRIEQLKVSAPTYFPEAELRSFREERKLIHKVSQDLAKMGPRDPEDNLPARGGSPGNGKSEDLRDKIKKRYQEIKSEGRSTVFDLAEEQEQDLELAVQMRTVFEDDPDRG